MGEADHLGDLPHQIEAVVDTEVVLALGEEVVEPDLERVVLEDERRPEFVLGESVDAQDPGMLERLEDLELAERRPLDLLAILLRALAPNMVEPHTPPH